MSTKQTLTSLAVILVVITGFLTAAVPASAASKEKVLYSYKRKHGTTPFASLIFDKAGNLYGTAFYGGEDRYCQGRGCGTVFQLTPGAHSTWTETVLYTFCAGRDCADGAEPYASLIFDAAGDLYGTTVSPGGNVFRLEPGANGTWTEKVLHRFGSAFDGSNPYGGVIFGAAGNLYGTTSYGGSSEEYGTVFQLSPDAQGDWTETAIYNFNLNGGGLYPMAGLVLGRDGNLYGTTISGAGSGCYGYGCGTVFQLTLGANGKWTESVLHNFSGKDGEEPYSALVFDAAGNLYGTTAYGGAYGVGTVFQLTPRGNGTWKETVLHDFSCDGKDGCYPYANLLLDAAGNLYGTTEEGGTYKSNCGASNGCGTVFRLALGANGKWTEKVLHNFGRDMDGAIPFAGLVSDAAGNLYGTTDGGGAYGYGTVFEITP
jgi:uncharacterized repeat protein (TIGR03803 family)